MNYLHVNQMWTLVNKPLNFSLIYCKLLFKVNHEVDSVWFEARLIAKGFTQKNALIIMRYAHVAKFTIVDNYACFSCSF